MSAHTLPSAAYVSAKNSTPKYHLDLECSALEPMRQRGLDPAVELVRHDLGHGDAALDWFAKSAVRACRLCALEHVAVALLPAAPGEPLGFISMTGQTPLEERALTTTGRIRSSFTRGSITDVTESSSERLQRIATSVGLPTVSTVAGPAAYGMVPRRNLRFLRTNLRTSEPDHVTSPPTAETVVLAWLLLCQSPPEIAAKYGAQAYFDDAWQLALATAS